MVHDSITIKKTKAKKKRHQTKFGKMKMRDEDAPFVEPSWVLIENPRKLMKH